MEFYERLRMEREELGLKQKEMAEKLKLPANTYNGYETGKRQPSLEVVAEISNILEVSTDYLLGRSDIRTPNVESNKEQKLSPEVETIAAHLEGKEITPKKMKLLKSYIDTLFDDFDDE